MGGVGRTANYTDSNGTTTVKKDYRKDNAARQTAVEATMPHAVTVTLALLADSLRRRAAGPSLARRWPPG